MCVRLCVHVHVVCVCVCVSLSVLSLVKAAAEYIELRVRLCVRHAQCWQ